MQQSDFRKAPVAKRIEKIHSKFGIDRKDDYFWLKDKTNPEVIDYLNKENDYTKEVMSSTESLQKELYDEILGRIKEDDSSYPYENNGYFYYQKTEKGKDYPIHLRKKGEIDAPDEILFDVNEMAAGNSAYIFAEYFISPNNKLCAYLFNTTGSYAEFTLRIRDLEKGRDFDFEIDGVNSFAWANNNKTFFYDKIDETLRPSKICKNNIDTNKEELVYEEKDNVFRTHVFTEKLMKDIFILSVSSTTSEYRIINADSPDDAPKVFMPRQKNVDYHLHRHENNYYIKYKNKENLNSKLYSAPLVIPTNPSDWKEIIPHREDEKLESIIVLEKYICYENRKDGLVEISIYEIESGKTKKIDFPEPVYSAFFGNNALYKTTKLRYGYMSLNRPSTVFEYDIITQKNTALKVQEIPSGFNSDDYMVERLWASAKDGVKVPISLVYKKGIKKDGSSPALLYSYGSYGYSTDADFKASVFSLVDRGYIYAIAHIRGGSELGESWYEDGKFLKKMNTFTDFIACSEHLINEGYTSPDKLSIMGGSAGGLLMGAVSNLRPDLFHSVLNIVPFVDVVTTMLDDSLPLTTGEYEEWGNPNDKEYFECMLSYSPYDNLEPKAYPHMLVTGGLNDSQVLFHEPAKYTARLRNLKTDNNVLLLDMNMDSGHGGATGRYSKIKDIALHYAFILSV